MGHAYHFAQHAIIPRPFDVCVFVCVTDPNCYLKNEIEVGGNSIWEVMRLGRENKHHGIVVVCCHLLVDSNNSLSKAAHNKTMECK